MEGTDVHDAGELLKSGDSQRVLVQTLAEHPWETIPSNKILAILALLVSAGQSNTDCLFGQVLARRPEVWPAAQLMVASEMRTTAASLERIACLAQMILDAVPPGGSAAPAAAGVGCPSDFPLSIELLAQIAKLRGSSIQRLQFDHLHPFNQAMIRSALGL